MSVYAPFVLVHPATGNYFAGFDEFGHHKFSNNYVKASVFTDELQPAQFVLADNPVLIKKYIILKVVPYENPAVLCI